MIEALIAAIAPKLIDGVLGLFGIDTTDPAIQAKRIDAEVAIKTQLITLISQQLEANNLQIQTNNAEAAAPNRKWITWRELVGYTCAAAFMYHYVIQQVLAFLLNATGHSVVLPPLDVSELMTILMGMLGLGTFDGVKYAINSMYNSPSGTPPKDNI